MIYNIETSKFSYDIKKNKKEISKLKELGFRFKKRTKEQGEENDYMIINELKIEIKTLAELTLFIKKYGQIVLNNNVIEIYNYYRE